MASMMALVSLRMGGVGVGIKMCWGLSGFYFKQHSASLRNSAQIIRLRLWVGESVMTSPHWAEVRFLVPPLSRWSAISSDMKVFKSTSWSPFLLRLGLEPLPTWVGDPGVLDRTLMLAIAPLKPGKTTQPLKDMCDRRWPPPQTWQLVLDTKSPAYRLQTNTTNSTQPALYEYI